MSLSASFTKIAPYADDFAKQLDTACQMLKLDVSLAQQQALLRYLDGLLLWTKAYNLTAITDPKEALIKHIFDCLAIVPKFVPDDITQAQTKPLTILDIGTGAGLPAVILAIVRPNWQISALDSNSKKIRFIRQMAGELGLKNITPIASRIELHTGCYDVITSRAFASLTEFVALSEPLLAPKGVLCAMKGKPPSNEELATLEAWQSVVSILKVPNLSDERCLVHLFKKE